MTCGLRQAGINVIAGVDFDQDAKETYEYNNPGSVFIQTNIKNLRNNYFERKFGIQKNDDFLILTTSFFDVRDHLIHIRFHVASFDLHLDEGDLRKSSH